MPQNAQVKPVAHLAPRRSQRCFTYEDRDSWPGLQWIAQVGRGWAVGLEEEGTTPHQKLDSGKMAVLHLVGTQRQEVPGPWVPGVLGCPGFGSTNHTPVVNLGLETSVFKWAAPL